MNLCSVAASLKKSGRIGGHSIHGTNSFGSTASTLSLCSPAWSFLIRGAAGTGSSCRWRGSPSGSAIPSGMVDDSFPRVFARPCELCPHLDLHVLCGFLSHARAIFHACGLVGGVSDRAGVHGVLGAVHSSGKRPSQGKERRVQPRARWRASIKRESKFKDIGERTCNPVLITVNMRNSHCNRCSRSKNTLRKADSMPS